MSGEETLAQVYRDVEAPKLRNFKDAALIVFVYSLLFTSLISFFAVMMIPEDMRIAKYSGQPDRRTGDEHDRPRWAGSRSTRSSSSSAS